eukprot:scaffold79805_cov17-Tisochrysis_lutea.AAC.1
MRGKGKVRLHMPGQGLDRCTSPGLQLPPFSCDYLVERSPVGYKSWAALPFLFLQSSCCLLCLGGESIVPSESDVP